MKFDGGYNVMLEGLPAAGLASYQKPEVLYLPLFSRRLDFSLLQVADGETVQKGQVLARDPVNYSVPLLAPVGGTVNLEAAERHITLEQLSAGPTVAPANADQSKRQALVELGVWSSFARIDNNRVPDPDNSPECLVIAVTRFEPYHPNPDTLLAGAIESFISGLARLHKLLDQVEVLLVIAQTGTDVSGAVRQAAVQHGAWLKFFEVPELYPFDSPALAARQHHRNPDKTWTTDVQTVLAVEAALEQGHPYVKRVVSVSGPMAPAPAHHLLPLGYPLAMLTAGDGAVPLRVVNGGILTGAAIAASQLGLDSECQALTVLEEQTEREVLAFVQPGFTKQSYSRTFASFFKPLFKEKSTTALGGEARPCVFCGFCEQVCPAGIIPHLIYRYLDHDRTEDAYRVEFDKCIDCGLCSYVCVSKINHLKMFRAERQRAITEAIEG